LARVLKKRWREPHILFIYAVKVATHYHYAKLVQSIADVDPETGAMSNAGRSFSRVRKDESATQNKDKEAIAA